MSQTRTFFLLTCLFFIISVSDQLTFGMPEGSSDDENNSYGWFTRDDPEWYLLGVSNINRECVFISLIFS